MECDIIYRKFCFTKKKLLEIIKELNEMTGYIINIRLGMFHRGRAYVYPEFNPQQCNETKQKTKSIYTSLLCFYIQ